VAISGFMEIVLQSGRLGVHFRLVKQAEVVATKDRELNHA
jgi:hypothetical protein